MVLVVSIFAQASRFSSLQLLGAHLTRWRRMPPIAASTCCGTDWKRKIACHHHHLALYVSAAADFFGVQCGMLLHSQERNKLSLSPDTVDRCWRAPSPSTLSRRRIIEGELFAGTTNVCIARVDSFACFFEAHTMRQIAVWHRHIYTCFVLPWKERGSSQSITDTDWKAEATTRIILEKTSGKFSLDTLTKWKIAHQSYRQIPVFPRWWYS